MLGYFGTPCTIHVSLSMPSVWLIGLAHCYGNAAPKSVSHSTRYALSVQRIILTEVKIVLES